MADETPLVCTQYDEFLQDKSLWVARLSDGTTVYQDDFRAGLAEHSAWLRLKTYLKETGLRIDRLWLKFRTHEEFSLPARAMGYFFCKSAMSQFLSEKTHEFYVIGYLVEDSILCQRWLTPELLLFEEDVRPAKDWSECLIVNPEATA